MLLIPLNNSIKKDKKIRYTFKKTEIKKIILKSLIYNNILDFYKKIFFDSKFKKFTFYSSIAKYRHNCMFLGNNRAVIQQFKLSRHSCKKYASLGFLIGLKKASF